MDHKLVPGRECGACNLCCITPALDNPEIQKLPGAVCRHCTGGCDIYETRPRVCREYYCGWRRFGILPDDWRPDLSGIFAEAESDVPPQFKASGGMTLILVGNPLKTLRRADFLDFVTRSVRSNVFLYLGLPGPIGRQSARLPLNTQAVVEAAGQSRSHVRLALEAILKALAAHDFLPHVLEHGGNDCSE